MCRYRRLVCFLVLVLVMMSGCGREQPAAPLAEPTALPAVGSTLDLDAVAAELVAAAGWEGEDVATKTAAATGLIESNSRTFLAGDVVHYEWHVRVGPGRYDVIGVHRVVREGRHGRPLVTRANLFLQHGDYKSFEGCFLPGLVSPRLPDDIGFAFYLAQNDVDVWGIDQAWCLVPADETNLSFMADWGMQRQVDDLRIAMTLARLVRCLTGCGSQPLLLSGFSTGGPIGFAALNQETQLPPGLRTIAGFIPVDQGLKTDVPEWAAICEGISANYQALLDGGQYQDFNPLPAFGGLALEDPAGDSPLVPGVTNLQAALILGTLPFFAGVSSHFCAGNFDTDGMPTGLRFLDTEVLVDFMAYAPPYEPVAYLRDEYLPSWSDASPWDDHLGAVTVPILFVVARGGFGYTGLHTLDLLGSTDVTVQEHGWGADDNALEYGHLDLFLDRDAAARVWQPVLTWVRDHSRPGVRQGAVVSQS